MINLKPKKGKYVENLKQFKFKNNSRKAFKYLSKKINVIIITIKPVFFGKVSMSSFNLINKYIKNNLKFLVLI